MRLALGAGEAAASQRGSQAEPGTRTLAGREGGEGKLGGGKWPGKKRGGRRARENRRDARSQAVRRPRREPAGPRRREEVGTARAKPRPESATHADLCDPVPSPGSSPCACEAGPGSGAGQGAGRRRQLSGARALSSRGSGRWSLLALTPRSARDASLRTRREGRGAGTRLSASRTLISAPATVTRRVRLES